MKGKGHIKSFNEASENLNSELSKDTSSSISDVMNSILSELKQELEWYNEGEAKTEWTRGIKVGRQQAMELAMEIIQKYCS